ncbi:hypothetical protein NEPAR05_0943 [Nematocida parisii]|nr:hypothetical protein NEPAR05_0943 [Nematocida parisii]
MLWIFDKRPKLYPKMMKFIYGVVFILFSTVALSMYYSPESIGDGSTEDMNFSDMRDAEETELNTPQECTAADAERTLLADGPTCLHEPAFLIKNPQSPVDKNKVDKNKIADNSKRQAADIKHTEHSTDELKRSKSTGNLQEKADVALHNESEAAIQETVQAENTEEIKENIKTPLSNSDQVPGPACPGALNEEREKTAACHSKEEDAQNRSAEEGTGAQPSAGSAARPHFYIGTEETDFGLYAQENQTNPSSEQGAEERPDSRPASIVPSYLKSTDEMAIIKCLPYLKKFEG